MIRTIGLKSRGLHQWTSAAAVAQQAYKILQESGAINSFHNPPSVAFSTSNAPSPPPSAAKKSPRHAPNDAIPRSSRNDYSNFRRLVDRGNAAAAMAAFEEYKLVNPSPPRHLYHSIMHLYNTRGQADQVAFLLRELIETGPGPNQHSFGYAMSSLKRAASNGTIPPKVAASRALELFETMISLGIKPNDTLYNELMDHFGKSGEVDKAFELFSRRLNDKIPPNAHTFSILIKACGVAKQLDRAADVLFQLMPHHGAHPSTSAWNGLLGAAAECGSVDRCYEIYQRMVEAGVMPDEHTDRVLAKAFASHPQLAAELVTESRAVAHQAAGIAAAVKAKSGKAESISEQQQKGKTTRNQVSEQQQWSVASSPSKQKPVTVDTWRKPGQLSADALGLGSQMPGWHNRRQSIENEESRLGSTDDDLSSGTRRDTSVPPLGTADFSDQDADTANIAAAMDRLQNLLKLDLHGHSQAAAQMALLRRLEALVEAWPAIRAVQAQHAQHDMENSSKNNNDVLLSRLPEGLVIVTGIGRGSKEGIGVLRDAVISALGPQGLTPERVHNNSGRLLIPWEKLVTFSESHWKNMQREHVFAVARVRYMTLGAGLAGVAAAAFIIPRLAPWLV